MSDQRFRKLTAALCAVALAASGCTSSDNRTEEPMAANVTLDDQWATAADAGMAAVFGIFRNTGPGAARVVAGSPPAAGLVEIHEVVPDAGGPTMMWPKAGGLTVAAGGATPRLIASSVQPFRCSC